MKRLFALFATLVGTGCTDVEAPTTPATPPPAHAVFPASGFALASVATGVGHACGITATAAAYCWGNNQVGQLGHGTTGPDEPAPVAVVGNLKFSQISAGGEHTCGVAKGGKAYCWGRGLAGQLGQGPIRFSSAPSAVSGGHTFLQVSAGRAHVRHRQER